MTIKQRQHLLAYLGYYVGNVDGDWGTLSRTACKAFQKDAGIPDDGFGGPETDKALKNAVANDRTKPEPVADSGTSNNGTSAPNNGTSAPNNGTSAPNNGTSAPNNGTFWDEIEFFDREEFRCQCGGKYCNGFPVEPEEHLVRTVYEIRRRLGVPVSIVDSGGSGVRCKQHNADVGGVANSNHLYGKAADLHSDKTPEEMAQVAESVMGNTGELGIYEWGIHVGVNCRYSRYKG